MFDFPMNLFHMYPKRFFQVFEKLVLPCVNESVCKYMYIKHAPINILRDLQPADITNGRRHYPGQGLYFFKITVPGKYLSRFKQLYLDEKCLSVASQIWIRKVDVFMRLMLRCVQIMHEIVTNTLSILRLSILELCKPFMMPCGTYIEFFHLQTSNNVWYAVNVHLILHFVWCTNSCSVQLFGY